MMVTSPSYLHKLQKYPANDPITIPVTIEKIINNAFLILPNNLDAMAIFTKVATIAVPTEIEKRNNGAIGVHLLASI